ncbi:hypothetical protein FSBG_00162 [Fusobacterium gonidiaformans 3-1-5R]|uniref:Uncharacterized protein n=1 Tax=Fusobacterium gonidiaformans 3-1-5R TaxID=469605 RepID=E5BEY4_9FUSO|nr:hypothetical protein [Fusobacterium gonidiaformans]EFS20665.1 hypothetical protein FSBG_00162 [Fusobacterium gonidiaformans 3-1-5R]
MKNYEYVCEFPRKEKQKAIEHCKFLNSKDVGKFEIREYTQSRLIATKETKPTTYIVVRRLEDENKDKV